MYRPNFVLVDRRPAPRVVVSPYPHAFRFAVPEHIASKPRPKPAK